MFTLIRQQIGACTLQGIVHHNYQETCTVQIKDSLCILDVYYNSKDVITRVKPRSFDPAIRQELLQLQALRGKKLQQQVLSAASTAAATQVAVPVTYSEEINSFLRELMQQMQDSGITIEAAEYVPGRWSVRFQIRQDAEQLTFDLFFNSKHRITGCQPVVFRGQSVSQALYSSVTLLMQHIQ